MKYSALLSPPSDNLSLPDNARLLTAEKIMRITPDNIVALTVYLQNYYAEDPYLRSAAYYATTGRLGLWVYRGSSSIIIFCRHPNVPGKHLVFPPVPHSGTAQHYDDMVAFIQDHAAMLGDYQFFRFSDEQARTLIETLSLKDSRFTWTIVPEMVLDTRYPSHIVSTLDLIDPAIPALRYFRRRAKRINAEDVALFTLDDPQAPRMAEEIFKRWGITESDYASYLINLSSRTLGTQGFCLTHQNIPSAVALWDVTGGIANALVTISDTEIPGMSAYLYQMIGQQLAQRGIEFMCLGGSEEEGLDFFKRKLNPVKSIDLVSIQVTKRAARPVTQDKIAA